MMLATVRTWVERAGSSRFRLLDLASAVPDELFAHQAPGDDWPARTHLSHALTSDGPVVTFVEGCLRGQASRDGLCEQVLAERTASIVAARQAPLAELLEHSRRERERLVAALAPVQPAHLELAVTVPGVRDAWGQPVSVSLARYLEAWCRHDLEHETAIRAAIATTPDLSAAALVRRRLG